MGDLVRIAAIGALGLGVSLASWSLASEPRGSAQAVVAPQKDAFGAKQTAGQGKKAEVPAEVMVLHATNSGSGIDEELRHLKQLQKPPFSSYDTYRLMQRHPLQLSPQQPNTTRLPNGRDLRTVLKEMLPEDRYRIATSISRPERDKDKKRSYLPLLEVTAKSGETFFVAGQSYQGGILVVGIRVGKEVKKPENK